jgi:hypothetical protein
MSNYNLIVTNDSRIQDITSKLDVVVRKGASASTFQRFPASSATPTQVTFNVPINSERTIIDRNVTIAATQELRIVVTKTGLTTAQQAKADIASLAFGVSESLQAFPFNSLITNAQVNLNDHSHSVNTQDLMGVLLKTIDNELLEYDCPYLTDGSFKSYADGILEENNPLKNAHNVKGKIPGRGAHTILDWTCNHTCTGGVNETATKTTYDAGNDTVKDAEIAKTVTTTNADDVFTWVIKYKTIEPVLFNPILLYSQAQLNNAGMYNVGQLSMNLSLDSSAKRSFSSSSIYPMTVELIRLTDVNLNINFLTPQNSSVLSATQVLPFVEHSRLLTINNGTVLPKASVTLVNSSFQLNQIPDMIYIAVRKVMSSTNCKDTNSFWPISRISVNFNNVDSIFSTYSADELHKMSVKNGVRQSKYEFLGSTMGRDNYGTVYTAGSVVAINPRDMNLPDYLAPGSIGQFTFQVTVDAMNTEGVETRPELLIIQRNVGILKNEAGRTTVTSGLLTQEMVTASTIAQFGESDDYIGSYSKGNNINSTIVGALKNVPLLNMKKSGGSYSGGSKSGGAYSGGGMASSALKGLF